ncbi:hypothetical protein MUB04_14170 [Acinetobacter indicus]|uniref:hypothetical protein n=1 Tax=Acinetobacter TaxID=469 RepID=UPI0015D18AA3|nr:MULTISPECIES: hypothetical protein [Acinetobacter]MCP0917676.1 hypothetical protein [Acinetobacter indicus]
MPQIKYGNVASDQLYLVRVQAGLDGTQVDGGDLLITRNNESVSENSMRNTVHFTLNGVVSNHVYGEFNHLFAFVSPLEQTNEKNKGLLAGLNPSDTFFHQNANDSLRLHQPTLVAPNGAEIPAHILDSGINVVRYDAPEVINGETLKATRDIAVGNVLNELGAPVNKIGMWGWSDTPDPTPEQRNALIESLGYDKEHIATVHTGSPEASIEELMGRYVYHNNRILNGEHLDTLDSGLQIPHIEQIPQTRQGILSTIEKMPNEEIRQKMTDRFNQIDQRFQQKLADYEAANTQKFGTINNFDDDNDFEFTGFNSPSNDQLDNDIGMVQPPPLPEEAKVSVPPPLPQDYLDSLDARYEDAGMPIPDQASISQFNSPPPPPPIQEDVSNIAMDNQNREENGVPLQVPQQTYDPFWDIGQDLAPPTENFDFDQKNFGEPSPGPNNFEGFDDAYMSQINSQEEPNNMGAQPMVEQNNDSVFEGVTIDLNSLTPAYLLHPKRTMDEIHQAFDSLAQAPANQVKAHFDKWKKQDIEELNNLVTNDARTQFDNWLGQHNEGKPLTASMFPTISGAWYNSPNGGDAAMKGLDADAFERVPVVGFQSINPKTRELQDITRYAIQAKDPAHPDVAKFVDARGVMVNDNIKKKAAANAEKKSDLDNLIATAPENGVYLGVEKKGLPLKSALNVVQHPAITGRAEEMKLGEDNEIDIAPNGLSFTETPREVYGIRSTDPDNPVSLAEFEAAENDRKRDFAVGMDLGSDITKPELSEKEAEKAVDAATPDADIETKAEDKPPVKKPNGRNNFKKNAGIDPGIANGFAGNTGGQGQQKPKGNNSKDLTGELDEQQRKPRKLNADQTQIETPKARYMVEQLLQAVQKALLAILKALGRLLKFLFNGSKAGYYAGKAAYLGKNGLDNFDAKMKRDNALTKTLDSLSFDRTAKSKSNKNGKGVAVANLPNSLGDKDPDSSVSAQLDKLNSKFADGTGRKYDTLASSIAEGKVVPLEPVNEVQLAEFDSLATTDTMFTTKNGERYVILGDAPTVEGEKSKYEVIKLSDSTIIPIERSSPDFQRNVVAVFKDEVAEQLESVAYGSKVLSPDIAANRNDYKNKPDAFFKKYPDEKEKIITTEKAVLDDRIGRLLQHNETGNAHVIVGVDTIALKDGSRAINYQTVEMTSDTPADLNYLRDAKIHTSKPNAFGTNSLTIEDVLDPKLKDRLVDLQMNGIEIQRNGVGLDLADLKTLGASIAELSKRGISRLTSSELNGVTNTLDDLAKIHPNAAVPSNEIKFDPAAVAEKLREKETQYVQDYLNKQNIDINDPSIKQGINSRVNGFFGNQKNKVEVSPLDSNIPNLSADQEVVPQNIQSSKLGQKAAFALDNDGIDYVAPVTTTQIVSPTINASPRPIDIDSDVNTENTAFIQSQNTSMDFKNETFMGPLPQEIEFKDIGINPHAQTFVYSFDNSIDYDREYDGVKVFEMPEFEPKDQTNEAYLNDVWNDAPRGAINEQVKSGQNEFEPIQLPDFKLDLPSVEAPQVTDATFDDFLLEFNQANPVGVATPIVESKQEAEINWNVDALKLDLAELASQDLSPKEDVSGPSISYNNEALFDQLLEEQPQLVGMEPAAVEPVMLTPEQEVVLDNAIEDMKARIEIDKKEMLMELEQEAQALQISEPNLETVAYIADQQEAIQKEMVRGPTTFITGEAAPIKLNFSMAEITTMPTMGAADLLANIRNPDFAEQMQLKTLANFASRNPDAKALTASELKAATEHVNLSDTSNLLRLHRDEQNNPGYEQSALFAPGLRSINGVEGDQSLMARRNRHESFSALKDRVLHELEASDNHPATVKMCEEILQTRINSDVTKLGRACESVGLQLNKGYTQSNNFENVAQFRETIKSQFPDTALKINDLVLNENTGDLMTVVGRRLEDIENNGVTSKAERLLVAKASAIGLVGTPEAINPADVKLTAEAGGRLTSRQIERFESMNLNDINGLDIKSAPSKLDLSHNVELDGAKNNILAMLTNPQAHPDDSLACELQDMRDSLNKDRDRFFEVQREVLHNPAVSQFMARLEDRLSETKMDSTLISTVLPVQNEQGALLKFENVVNFDTLNMLREMNSTNKADENGFYKQTDFAKVLIEANDPKLNAQVAELGRLSRNITDTMGSIDEIRAEMVTQVFNDAENQGKFTKEDITHLHQQVTNDTISTRESLPAILGSVAQYSEVANYLEQNRSNPTPMTNEEIVNEGKGKFGKFMDKVSSMFKRGDNEQEQVITGKANDLFNSKANKLSIEKKVEVEVEKNKRQDNDSSLSM